MSQKLLIVDDEPHIRMLIEQTLEKAWQNRNRWEEMGRRSFALFKEKFPDRPEAYLLKQLSS